MNYVIFTDDKECNRLFLDFPATLYGPQEIMQNIKEETALLEGAHFLNRYVTLTKFLVMENEQVLARCVLTEYPEEDTAYVGFFECVQNEAAAILILNAAEKYAQEKGYRRIVGPLDVSIWIRYRFKTNLFDRRPYCGEPCNKPYYPEYFHRHGYSVLMQYVSNCYQKLPKEGYALNKYQARYEEFLQKGYQFISPKARDWERCVREVHQLVSRLYAGFQCYHAVTEDEFVSYLSSYKHIVDYSLIKLAYYEGKAVGFFMGIPNYHNLSGRKLGIRALSEVMIKRRHAPEYVLLYMGVEPEHQGLGKALTHSIMSELAKKGAASIGSLIQDQNPNYNYAEEYMGERYQYELLEKRLSDTGLSHGGKPEVEQPQLHPLENA